MIFYQGLGLYANRDIEKHTMVIEYIGQLIRNEIAERNELIYETQVSFNLFLIANGPFSSDEMLSKQILIKLRIEVFTCFEWMKTE